MRLSYTFSGPPGAEPVGLFGKTSGKLQTFSQEVIEISAILKFNRQERTLSATAYLHVFLIGLLNIDNHVGRQYSVMAKSF